MIISRGRRYIFVHIPKTGGTALTLALEARAKKDDILIGDTPKAQARRGRLKVLKAAGRLWKHSTLADIDGVVATQELDDLYILTLVRNPWDRIVSYYHWLRRQSFSHPAVALSWALNFHDFLNHPLIIATFRNGAYGSYVRDRTGAEHAARFARLEHLEQDLVSFEAHLGFRLMPLSRANESARARDWREYYSAEDAALVANICTEDIARFGYRFDP